MKLSLNLFSFFFKFSFTLDKQSDNVAFNPITRTDNEI
jgi:hypothetical protein